MSRIEAFNLEMEDAVFGPWTLAGRLHWPEGEPRGLAIAAHGLYADMSSLKHRALCRMMAGRGLAAVRFDARGCGLSSGRMAETTLTGRAQAVLELHRWLAGRTGLPGPLVLTGSSFGAAAVLLAASFLRDEGPPGPAAVISMAAPCDFQPLVEKWEDIRQGEMEQAYFDDLSSLDMPACLTGLGPLLIIHAVEDEVIPVDQALSLMALAGPGSRLALLHGSDHALHAPGATERALEEAADFLDRLNLDTRTAAKI